MEIGNYYKAMFDDEIKYVWVVNTENDWVVVVERKFNGKMECFRFYRENKHLRKVQLLTGEEKKIMEEKMQVNELYLRYQDLMHPTLLMDYFLINITYEKETQEVHFTRNDQKLTLYFNPYEKEGFKRVLTFGKKNKMEDLIYPVHMNCMERYFDVNYVNRLRNFF